MKLRFKIHNNGNEKYTREVQKQIKQKEKEAVKVGQLKLSSLRNKKKKEQRTVNRAQRTHGTPSSRSTYEL